MAKPFLYWCAVLLLCQDQVAFYYTNPLPGQTANNQPFPSSCKVGTNLVFLYKIRILYTRISNYLYSYQINPPSPKKLLFPTTFFFLNKVRFSFHPNCHRRIFSVRVSISRAKSHPNIRLSERRCKAAKNKCFYKCVFFQSLILFQFEVIAENMFRNK